ncbi:S-phase kinase-associated protein 2-like [Antedon mediterranea]|uniref:S-phase kinase-associated protein 2-like n=1 Tax=Antedon mediterranea TaxID=105859 RepID=UPI003AF85939
MASRKKVSHAAGRKRTRKRSESIELENKLMRFISEPVQSELYKDLGVEVLKPSLSDDEEDSKSKSPPPSVHTASKQVDVYDITSTPSPVRNFPVHDHTGQTCSCQRVKKAIPSKTIFKTLTDEVILSILKWLPIPSLLSCAGVCKRWRTLAYDDSLWRKINLTGYHFSSGTLGKVLERGCVAVKLAQASIEGSLTHRPNGYSLRKRSYKQICQLNSNQPKLAIEYLDLSNCKIDDDQILYHLLSRCNKLRKLSLESANVNDNLISVIARLSCNTLEDINLGMCTGLTEKAFFQIFWCKSLRSLNLSCCKLTSAQCLLPFFLMPYPSLKHLNLSGYRFWMNDLKVAKLVENCPNLLDLDLSDSSLTTESVSVIVQGLKDLKHISLSRCYDIEKYSLLKFKSMAHLEALDVFGIVDQQTLDHLKAFMPKLRINKCPFSVIARPTTRAAHKNSIWDVKCWD